MEISPTVTIMLLDDSNIISAQIAVAAKKTIGADHSKILLLKKTAALIIGYMAIMR